MHILKQLKSAAPICIYLPNAQIQTCIRCFEFSEAPGGLALMIEKFNVETISDSRQLQDS